MMYRLLVFIEQVRVTGRLPIMLFLRPCRKGLTLRN